MEKIRLTEDHLHEALDRSHLVGSMFDQFLVQHTAVQGIPELQAKANEISEALGDFYQLCGQAMGDFDADAEIMVEVEL